MKKNSRCSGGKSIAMPKIDTCYHVPYLGGVSKDGMTVYIDSGYPHGYTQKDGKYVNTLKYLTAHEWYEFKLMESGMEYNQAHRKAAHFEKDLLKNDGIDVGEYYEFIYKHVKKIINRFDPDTVPKDLDMRPYVDDGLSSVLKKLGLRQHIRHPHSATEAFLNEEMKKDIIL